MPDFEDHNNTFMRPSPGGGKRGSASDIPAFTPAALSDSIASHAPAIIRGAALNPIVSAATSLLALVSQLREAATYPNPEGLRQHIVSEIKKFEENARAESSSPELILAARYAICTVLDETVLCTPWGSESAWSKQTLLSVFHNETWGGEKFFQIIDRLQQEPSRNIELLELLGICLYLGFEGKYRVMERGRAKLDEIQDNLHRTIRLQRGDFERDLSPHWQGLTDHRNALIRYVPLWVVAALSGALLLASYSGFSYILKSTSDPVYEQLKTIGTPIAAPRVDG